MCTPVYTLAPAQRKATNQEGADSAAATSSLNLAGAPCYTTTEKGGVDGASSATHRANAANGPARPHSRGKQRNDKIPRVIEEEGRPIAVLAPADHYMRDNAGGAEPTLAHDVLSFYSEMSQRSDVSDLLARLARK
jgi:hypothetical protein